MGWAIEALFCTLKQEVVDMSEPSKRYREFLGFRLDEGQLTPDNCVLIDEIERREFYICSEICSEVTDYIVPWIERINQMDGDKPAEEREPIILFISSPGGSVFDGFAIIDAIERSKTPIWTVNAGYCFSMAFHIFITGHERFSSKTAIFLHHDGSDLLADSSLKIQDYAEFNREYRGKIITPNVLSHTRITVEELRQNERREWYMFADEAKEKGVFDHYLSKELSLKEIVAADKST